MRVLILFVFVACAAAAPSVQLPILPFLPSPTLFRAPIAAIPLALPTVPAGDIQAAAINAQVKAEDHVRALADQARELAEIAAENQNEGIIEANDLAKEKSEQAFWNAEEQKWQALDALKTAEAQADAVVAKSASIPYAEAAIVPEAPASEQAMPGIVAKAVEIPAAAPEAAAEVAAEAPKAEEQIAVVKMAEPEVKVEAEAEKTADSIQVESADLRAAAPEPAKLENKNPLLIQPYAHAPIFTAPLSIAPLAYSQPFVAPVAYIQPGLKAVASSAIHSVQGHLIPQPVLQAQW